MSKPVENVVESTGTSVEDGSVQTVLLICVEPVGSPKHWEEENDEGFVGDGLVEAFEFGYPGWVFHEDYFGTIWSDNVIGVAEKESDTCTDEHEDDECDISAIVNSTVGFDIDILTEWDLKIMLV